MTAYGAGQLYNSKYYGLAGMEALRAVLKHANQYGLKYIFVRDRFYEPLLAFAGWRQTESYDNGNVTLVDQGRCSAGASGWSSSASCRPRRRASCGEFCRLPAACLRCSWFCLLPERRRVGETLEFPAPVASEPMVLREAK